MNTPGELLKQVSAESHLVAVHAEYYASEVCMQANPSPSLWQNNAGMMLEWGTLGRLKPDDIPSAAVDFHISNIIEDLLSSPNVLAAANTAAAKTGRDTAGLLKSAMWHFSGSCNHRSQLQVSNPHRSMTSCIKAKHRQ